MGISNFTLNRIYQRAEAHLLQARIERVIHISDSDFLLSLYKDGKTRNLLLSLDPSLPIFIESQSYKVQAPTATNPACNMLKKYLEHGTVVECEKAENDRILLFRVKKWSPSYQMMDTRMIFEVFPLSPNIIFTDADFRILDALKCSDSLDSKHPIYRNLRYQFPPASDKQFDADTPIEQMQGKLNRSEFRYLQSLSEEDYRRELKKLLNEEHYYLYKNDVSSMKICAEAEEIELDRLYDILLKRKEQQHKEERYQHIFRLVHQKLRSIRKRLQNIEADRLRFSNCSEYQEKGNLLYLAEENYHKGMTRIEVEGVSIELDPLLDLKENAQRYFRLYKKAKSGLVQVEIQRQHALEELDDFERIASQLMFASHEDMQEIILDLAEHHYLKDPRAQQRAKKRPANQRYAPHFIRTPDGCRIGYGLSSYQNEELTFAIAKKNDLYLHIKDFHGPHVILFHSENSEKHLLLAGEIALYFAGHTSGQVSYTLRENVKKVPGKRGLATMTHYRLMTIAQIRESTLALLERR